ncbi:membrane protein [Streptomyces hygroscopicus]|nr:membrane protein [Streptomyces hygroscopicus]
MTYEQVASGGLPVVGMEKPVVPRLSAGLQLHGEYQGSGFTEPRYIARRGDGQVVQLSRLLHLVASSVDGSRDIETIAHRVSARFGREVSAENIRYLIENKLDPLGVTVPEGQEDDQVSAPRSDLLLALKGHRVLFNERRVTAIARALAWLHRPLVVAAVLVGIAALDVWLFVFFGAITPVLEVLDQPVLLLVVFVLTVASLVFHEFGHASACRYGGARPGCIGCGLFLIWPSMYTDVTDVYRIGRAGRLRTDLGGVYFNVVFMLAMAGAYALSGQAFFLAAVYLGHFEILEQLMPAVRLDGYYILGDLAGVPDLYGKIKPILLSLVPGAKGRKARAEVAALKKSARTIVATWVLTMVPLLVGELGYALWNLPRITATMIRSLSEQLVGTGDAFVQGQIAAGLMGVVGCVMLLCPMAGVVYLSVKLGGRLWRGAVKSTAGRPRLRVALCALFLVGLGGLSYAWVSGLTPEPLPKKPPIAPILQPGVSTSPPPARRVTTPDRSGATPPSTARTAPVGTASPNASAARSVSASPSGSASPKPSSSKPSSRGVIGQPSGSPVASGQPPVSVPVGPGSGSPSASSSVVQSPSAPVSSSQTPAGSPTPTAS